VGHGNRSLNGDQCGRQGGVHVTDNDDGIYRRQAIQSEIEFTHDVRRLGGVTTAGDFQGGIGDGQFELAEEDLRKTVIIVLPGVKQGDPKSWNLPQSLHDGAHLYKIRTGSNDRNEVFFWIWWQSVGSFVRGGNPQFG
jgi:hypothetical protein